MNPYPLRINEELMNRLKTLADNEKRSVNKEIEFLILKAVEESEKENEKIKEKK